MANNLIKWWRTKFLNGYKQFSVIQSDCSDGRPSDTEELLGHASDSGGAREHGYTSAWVSESALPTCNTPTPPPSATAQPCGNKQRTGAMPSSTQTHIPPGTQQSNNNATPTQTPPPNVSSTKHLNLEEFSCDVSMESGIYRDGQERQEFSFTLYDFDGHGKITKDDIAGLVTTIYETLGSSVKIKENVCLQQ
ncbi:naked cuticle [Carabus blaptoides fortunei]